MLIYIYREYKCKVSSKNSKRLLKNVQNTTRDSFFHCTLYKDVTLNVHHELNNHNWIINSNVAKLSEAKAKLIMCREDVGKEDLKNHIYGDSLQLSNTCLCRFVTHSILRLLLPPSPSKKNLSDMCKCHDATWLRHFRHGYSTHQSWQKTSCQQYNRCSSHKVLNIQCVPKKRHRCYTL